MEKEIYTPMEKVLIEGANRLEHNQQLMLLLDYELDKLIEKLEKEAEAREEMYL